MTEQTPLYTFEYLVENKHSNPDAYKKAISEMSPCILELFAFETIPFIAQEVLDEEGQNLLAIVSWDAKYDIIRIAGMARVPADYEGIVKYLCVDYETGYFSGTYFATSVDPLADTDLAMPTEVRSEIEYSVHKLALKMEKRVVKARKKLFKDKALVEEAYSSEWLFDVTGRCVAL